MARQYKNGTCSCFKQVDKLLAEHNTQLSQSFTFTGHHYLQVATERTDGSRKKPKLMVAAFCPFCGEKLKDPDTPTE